MLGNNQAIVMGQGLLNPVSQPSEEQLQALSGNNAAAPDGNEEGVSQIN